MTELFQSGELPAQAKPRAIAILMRDTDVINMKELIYRTGYSYRHLRTVCKKYGICRQLQPGSPMEVSWVGWIILKHGNHAALDLLRQGLREHPDLAKYFVEAGVPV